MVTLKYIKYCVSEDIQQKQKTKQPAIMRNENDLTQEM